MWKTLLPVENLRRTKHDIIVASITEVTKFLLQPNKTGLDHSALNITIRILLIWSNIAGVIISWKLTNWVFGSGKGKKSAAVFLFQK